MNRSTRRAFLRDLAGLGASMAGLGALAGCATPPPASSRARPYHVGALTVAASSTVMPPFWARLEELGYVEGRNLVKVDRTGGRNAAPGELAIQATEMVGLPVDVIVAGNPPAIRAAMAATTSIPIVMIGTSADPVASGFVASLARPGGNVTGVVGSATDLEAKRLQLLLEAAPRVSKVAVLGTTVAVLGTTVGSRAPLQAAAQLLGVALVFESVDTRDFDAAFEHAVAEGADALLVRNTALTSLADREPIIGLAERYRLPASYPSGAHVQDGGLMAYEARASDIARRAADYVDRILRGTNPADLPVELPTRYDLVVNLRTARALGLTLSPTFLAQVEEVIE